MISNQIVRYALRNLNKKKARSFFTILSIFLGISTIFIFVSYGLGLFEYVNELTEGSSADKLVIQPKGNPLALFDSNVKFDDDDIKAIERIAGVKKVSGSYFKTVEVNFQDEKLFTLLVSFDPKNPLVMDVSNIGIFKGRQVSSGKREAVLGYNYLMDDKIFPKSIRLNQNIEVNGENMKVVGFLESVGNPQDDAQIYTSNVFMRELFENQNLSYLWLIAQVEVEEIDSIKMKIEKELRRERNLDKGKEDFFVQSFNDLVEGFSTAINIIIGFIILIALVSVLVSSVNTANTMITSVLERINEIGIIKSIGARNSDVFGIFLFESGFLGFIAGIIGVVLGWGLSALGGSILNTLGYGFLQPAFPIWLFVACVLFATITGAISGVWPAISASKINTVDALRYN
jgi:putative ABC transport system permease protein